MAKEWVNRPLISLGTEKEFGCVDTPFARLCSANSRFLIEGYSVRLSLFWSIKVKGSDLAY